MIMASASPSELLTADDAEPWADLRQHPVISSLREGTAPLQLVRDLVAALYPVFTGRARYILAAKVSFLGLDDGKAVFEDLYRSLTMADADADRGFATLANALGFSAEDVRSLRAHPTATAEDLVAIVQEHGHRSAHQGVGTALVFDRQLPVLFGDLADALATHYGVPEEALAHLRFRAAEADAASVRVGALAARYLTGPLEVFEARRAAREVLWDLTALIDTVPTGPIPTGPVPTGPIQTGPIQPGTGGTQ
jgi:pyrroloquinoline quinone (PQQ) biosynthesis protein C